MAFLFLGNCHLIFGRPLEFFWGSFPWTGTRLQFSPAPAPWITMPLLYSWPPFLASGSWPLTVKRAPISLKKPGLSLKRVDSQITMRRHGVTLRRLPIKRRLVFFYGAGQAYKTWRRAPTKPTQSAQPLVHPGTRSALPSSVSVPCFGHWNFVFCFLFETARFRISDFNL